MARTAQISKEKRQSIITLRHEGQSLWKISRTFKVSSAVAKTIKRYRETGSHKDRHRTGRPRVTYAAKDKIVKLAASEIANQINARVRVKHASQHHLFRGDCVNLYGRIAAKKPPLKNTNKKKRLVWAKKHEQWTLDRWISALWSDESKFEIFGSNRRVFVRRRVGERMISACVVPTVKHGGGGVMLWGCFADDIQ
jgi:transposase-like protein